MIKSPPGPNVIDVAEIQKCTINSLHLLYSNWWELILENAPWIACKYITKTTNC